MATGKDEGKRPAAEKKTIDYKAAGVDIQAGEEAVNLIKRLVEATYRAGVLGTIGGFGGMFEIDTEQYRKPVLIQSTDGVGTKLKVAFMADRHDTIGIDLVAMCVNDIIVQGAEPQTFLDYIATGKLKPEVIALIIQGIAIGCKMAGCALTGGEMAELPGFYKRGEYDCAGFVTGIVDKDKIIDGSKVKAGNRLIGLASSGLHSNGYSLARKIFFDVMGLHVTSQLPALCEYRQKADWTIGDELLVPTRIYVKAVLDILEQFPVNGMAHITGGGLLKNIPRMVPHGLKAVLDRGSWEVPPIFPIISKRANINEVQQLETFNWGIGLVMAVDVEYYDAIMQRLGELGETPYCIGAIEKTETPVDDSYVEMVGEW